MKMLQSIEGYHRGVQKTEGNHVSLCNVLATTKHKVVIHFRIPINFLGEKNILRLQHY